MSWTSDGETLIRLSEAMSLTEQAHDICCKLKAGGANAIRTDEDPQPSLQDTLGMVRKLLAIYQLEFILERHDLNGDVAGYR